MSVYFFVSKVGGDLLVKIGCTRRSPLDRLAEIQSVSPVEVDLFGAVEGGRALEMRLHRIFDDERQHGEWFEASEPLRGLIFDVSDAVGRDCETPLSADQFECLLASALALKSAQLGAAA